MRRNGRWYYVPAVISESEWNKILSAFESGSSQQVLLHKALQKLRNCDNQSLRGDVLCDGILNQKMRHPLAGMPHVMGAMNAWLRRNDSPFRLIKKVNPAAKDIPFSQCGFCLGRLMPPSYLHSDV